MPKHADVKGQSWPLALERAGVRFAAALLLFAAAAGAYAQANPPDPLPEVFEGDLPGRPLTVTESSRIVVMEYEAWFGPNALTFQNSSAIPLLQSADMRSLGGGYDSADPKVIQQHVRWLEQIGVDAAIADSPGFAMAHLLKAWLNLLGTEPAGLEVARAAHRAAGWLSLVSSV